jgi:hypothetical protein
MLITLKRVFALGWRFFVFILAQLLEYLADIKPCAGAAMRVIEKVRVIKKYIDMYIR